MVQPLASLQASDPLLPIASAGKQCAGQQSLYLPKEVYAEKCKREPLCCLKCHGWNHMASSCPQQHDICRTCAQHHCMAQFRYFGRICKPGQPSLNHLFLQELAKGSQAVMMPELTGNTQVTQFTHSIYILNLLIYFTGISIILLILSIYILTIINKKRVGACPKALGMWAGFIYVFNCVCMDQ